MNTPPKKKAENSTAHGKLERLLMLYDLFHSITATLEPKKALDLIIDAAVKITNASYGSLILIDWQAGMLNIEVSRGFIKPISDVRLKVGEGITGWVAKNGKPILVSDASSDPRYVTVLKKIRSELAVPLVLDDRIIGVLNVDSTRVNAFSEDDLDLLTLLSKQSAQVIKNGELFDTVSRKVEELSSLININKAIASTLDSDKILRMIVGRAARLMNAALCSVMLLSEDGEALTLKAHHGGSADYAGRPPIEVARSTIGQVISTRRSMMVADIDAGMDSEFTAMARREGLKSLLSVPLIGRNGVIGLVNTYKTQPYHFSVEEKRLMKTFADLCAIAIDNAQLYETMVTLEEQARQAEKLSAVGELAVSVAHEIRNPLTIIKMLFESGEELDSRDREVISEELNHMNSIISHLLDFTRSKEIVRERCRLRKSLKNALFLLERSFDKKHIAVITELAEDLPKILADPVQLQQVFLNLLLNAGEALPGGGEIRVRTRLLSPTQIEIQISDNGPGFPPEVLQNLFTPFTTTKPAGLGLGLSIVKRIIDGHEGEIHVDSTVNKGTTITIRLPIHA